MPCEIGSAAMLKVLNENSEIIQMDVSDCKNTVLVQEKMQLSANCLNPCHFIFFGTYWPNMNEIAQTFPNDKYTIYCFGKDAPYPSSPYFNIVTSAQESPCQFLFKEATKNTSSASLISLFVSRYSKVMSWMDDRMTFKNIHDNQPFFTGMFNIEHNIPLFDRYMKLFTGQYDLDYIVSTGKQIVDSQIHLASERAIHNSKQVELKDGTKAIMTEAPELVNLSHDALKQQYPDAKMTIVVNMKLQSNQLAYSFRSFNGNVDVSQYARTIQGDGSNTCAGGRIPWTVPVPF